MKWTTLELIKLKNINNKFKGILNYNELATKITDIYEISEILVEGEFNVYNDERFVFDLKISGDMILACAVSLKEVKYNIDITVSEVFCTSEDEDCNLIDGITIDLFSIVWSNILLDKPMRVLAEGAYDNFDNEIVSFSDEVDEYVNPVFKDLEKFK